MNRYSLLGSMLLALVAASCARAPVQPVEWPEDLPPIGHYHQIYDQDEENQAAQSRTKYLEWVVRFYNGWKLHQDGWHATTRDVLHGIEDGADKQRLRRKMAHLGRMISGEWAKNSRSRRIRSQQLSVWGQALLDSIERGDEETLIDQVTHDVEALLSGDLDPTEITLARY